MQSVTTKIVYASTFNRKTAADISYYYQLIERHVCLTCSIPVLFCLAFLSRSLSLSHTQTMRSLPTVRLCFFFSFALKEIKSENINNNKQTFFFELVGLFAFCM